MNLKWFFFSPLDFICVYFYFILHNRIHVCIYACMLCGEQKNRRKRQKSFERKMRKFMRAMRIECKKNTQTVECHSCLYSLPVWFLVLLPRPSRTREHEVLLIKERTFWRKFSFVQFVRWQKDIKFFTRSKKWCVYKAIVRWYKAKCCGLSEFMNWVIKLSLIFWEKLWWFSKVK